MTVACTIATNTAETPAHSLHRARAGGERAEEERRGGDAGRVQSRQQRDGDRRVAVPARELLEEPAGDAA